MQTAPSSIYGVDITGLEDLLSETKILTLCGCAIVGEEDLLTLPSVVTLHMREHFRIQYDLYLFNQRVS